MMSKAMASCSVAGLAARSRRAASSLGMRLRRQAVSASSLDELRFGGGGGLVFVAEFAAVGFVGGGVFGWQDGESGGEAVS